MAKITVVDEKTIKIAVDLEETMITMTREAEKNVERYAKDIVTIYEKMPEFQFVHFCFYAYDSAALFEHMLGSTRSSISPFPRCARWLLLYPLRGMAALYERAKAMLPPV